MTSEAEPQPARGPLSAGEYAFLACTILFWAAFVIVLGKDTSWDFRNYHWYGPYALFNHRLGIDVAVAHQASWYNPYLDIPFYLLATHFPSWVAVGVLGAVQGANVVPLYLMARHSLRLPDVKLWAGALAILGQAGAHTLTEFGTTYYDNVMSVLVLTGLAILVVKRETLRDGPPGRAAGLALLAGFVTVFFAFLIGPIASRMFGKVKGAIVLFCISYVISITPLVLGLMGIALHPGMPNLVWILLAFGAISGAMTIGASIPVTAMIADVVEDSELKTGRRSEGLFFAGNSFLAKAVTGLGLFASGVLLWAAGFPTGAIPGKVDPAIVHHFALVYLITITVVYGLGIIVLSMFPITRESHQENLRTLAAEMAQAQEPVDMGVIR